MDLFKEILIKILEKEKINVVFPNLPEDMKEIFETQCYIELQKIKAVIEDDSLSDFNCIEKIVRIFEEIGSGVGNRHDF